MLITDLSFTCLKAADSCFVSSFLYFFNIALEHLPRKCTKFNISGCYKLITRKFFDIKNERRGKRSLSVAMLLLKVLNTGKLAKLSLNPDCGHKEPAKHAVFRLHQRVRPRRQYLCSMRIVNANLMNYGCRRTICSRSKSSSKRTPMK